MAIANFLASIHKLDNELSDPSRPVFISVPTVTNDPNLSSFLTQRLEDHKFISLRNKLMGHSLPDTHYHNKLTERIIHEYLTTGNIVQREDSELSELSRKASKRPRIQSRHTRPMSAPPDPNHT